MKKRFVVIGLLVIASVGSWMVLDHRSGHAQAAPAGPPKVTVARVLERPVSASADFTGRIEPVDSVEVRPRVDGYIEAVTFKEGALVHKGDVLFRIDPRPYQAEVDRLQAKRDQAKADLKLARDNAERAHRLLAKHAIAKAEADRQIVGAQSARAALQAADAALSAARLNLGFTNVRAPIDGRVSNAHVTPGNLVTSSSALTSIVSVNPVYAYFDVDEHTWLKLDHLRAAALGEGRKPQVAVALGLSDEQGYPHTGQLDFVDNQLHTESGTMRLRAVFDNRHGLFTPGLYAHVRVKMGQPKPRMLIDDRAIGTDLANQFVYVVDAQHEVQYRRVSTGPLFHGLRVIDSGLKAGDEVVVNGLQRVRPGIEVNAEQVAMDYRLGAGDKALVEAAGVKSRQDRRTAQTNRDGADASPVASRSPRERRPQAGRVALPAGG